ncbi:bifunctional helix-turn-helix transcriptional regulator/GNAT family N-acetyltransferase [Nonomuraea dietziae]|uniref:DNA-binding MarR family transcriptional regulator/predicted N-acetyltransferase YhbS n=1 Tax=Nonomuraea dietziae TaxID=65515 RepID=A0A7W5YU13_9ACTN|nr:helix-turn-helix domain-containing GNAT family N-acetyltransferase [Nonomuraea dietziae]MBB3732084.1 DNA-binding MarR family transcriptional regulator/predicted N-acetyltransferase YhbS [Nonomuraea dietziae]
MNSLTEARIEEIRAFNRFYTKVIGVLQSGMLDSPYSLTEARVLFELAQAEGLAMEAGELRRLLDLDAGYLSRILTRFCNDGLIVRERSATDARRQIVSLTEAGSLTFARLDQRQAEEIATLLEGLSEEDRGRLGASMATIRSVLDRSAAPRGPYVIRAPRAGDLGWVVWRHGSFYSQEYGWGLDFEKLVAGIVSAYDPARDAGWIAEIDGTPVGSVFCMHKDDTTAQLRMLMVEPSARGLGLGGRLVEECLRHARESGYKRIMLWTRDCLVSARRIYQAAGFALESEEKAVENGVEVVEQVWTRDL